MGTLREEFEKLNEERQEELEAKRNARTREIQAALAEDLELARSVPAALAALAKEHRAAAREALETLEMIDAATLGGAQDVLDVDSIRRRVAHVLTMFEDGSVQATRAVDKVDGLTHLQVKDWAPAAYTRVLRDELRAVASYPGTIKAIMENLSADMQRVRRIMLVGRRRDASGAGFVTEPASHIQTVAHSRTQGT